ncbi:baseplate J/gp47 family protein [Brucella intermedia]|uniref:Baseplate J family protein n=1 Tax=Brucella intermedia M86 TaxID=1234597 RepID=M5K2B3_9HYPH|nr:baseplate J/gp47 family protein [Brucella intermedia]ELT51019.1 baseplate J family protein [Brucella intermedia M86]
MAMDLTALPPPDVIETLDYEAILALHIATFKQLWTVARQKDPTLPAYDVEILETDPVKIVLEATAYMELLLRARINDAARANLIAFALGGDLDQLAAFYDVIRLEGETDAAFRSRVVLAIQARSPAGGAYWYAAAARRASVRIRDVAVYREEFWPIIHIAILSHDNGGIPDQAMLDAVRAIVTSDEVRPLNDTVIVEAAVSAGTDIEANIWLLPSAPSTVMDSLEPALRKAWNEETGIGFDLIPSWIEARLHLPGVQRVQVLKPAQAVIVPPGTAIALGEIKLNFKGRDY